ncbi:MAG: sulfotransferase [Flavobacteriales bacterium]|nr:sulfotransferase [Flavobacteriales bacterium]
MIKRLRSIKTSLDKRRRENEILKFNNDNKKNGRFDDFSKHIIISGEPRGGTTWLMELLMNDSTNLVWEPLFHKRLNEHSAGLYNKFGHMPYIPENAQWKEGKEYFNSLFRGELKYGLFKNHHYSGKKLKDKDRMLFKFCRANMLLPWLTKEFPTIKPIYLVRHPLSVISSQFRHPAFEGIGTKVNLFELRKSENPMFSDIFDRYEDKISKINSRESMFANWWAIQNMLALPNPDNKWLTVSYESLYLNPVNELERISKFTGIPVSEFSLDNIEKPSKTTLAGSGILEKKDQLSNFRKHLTQNQINEILEIINSYGIDAFNEDLEPDYMKLRY